MSSFTVPDCLVLKIEEYDADTLELDTSVFILYDFSLKKYVIRGKRSSVKGEPSSPYSFICDKAKDLTEFLSFVICNTSVCTYILYNYDNLESNSDDITYDFLNKNESELYEIGGYSYEAFNRKDILKYVKMLKKVYNFF